MNGTRTARLALLAMLALVVVGSGASAHAYLASSTPMPGGAVPQGTTVLALRFTEQIDPSHVRVDLTGPGDASLPAHGEVPRSRPTEVRVTTDPMPEGVYVLSWRVLSVDGHVEEGSMRFTAGDGEAGANPLQDASGEPPNPGDIAEGVARAGLMAGLLAAIGLPLFVSEVAKPAGLHRRVPAALVLLLAGSLVAAGVLLWLLAGSLDAGVGQAVRTRPGGLLLAQGGLAALALALAATAWRRAPQRRLLPLMVAVIPASLAIVVNSMGGHGVLAFASREAVAGHVAATAHVIAVGLWVGGLLGFVLLRGVDGVNLGEVVDRFFPLGVISVLVVGATGLYQAYVHVPELADVWQSPYGQLLLAKTAGLIVLVAFGAVHQRWLRPRLLTGGSQGGTFRRAVALELVVLASIVVLAGVLAAAPLPDAPLDPGPGPAATFEQEAPTDDFWVHIAFDDARLLANRTYNLTIELQPRTSIPPEQVDPSLTLQAPGQGGSNATAPPNATADPVFQGGGTWLVEGLGFHGPGTWRLGVLLDTPAGPQKAVFDVPVTSDNGPGDAPHPEETGRRAAASR